MPATINSSTTSCYGKSRNRTLSDSLEEKKIFKTKVDILNCKPEDVKLKMEGNRVIIEGKLFKNKSKEAPVYFSKHYIMPENCDLAKMRYTITPDGVFITAPRRDGESCSDWPTLEESCTSNCVDLKDKFEIRLNVQEFRAEDIKIKVNGNTITIKAKHLQETGMKRVIKTYSLPETCEITKLEREFTPHGHLILTVPKFLGLFYDSKSKNPKSNDETLKNNVKCKFNITTEKFEIKIDVANFKPSDINIIQQKRMVTIEGKRFKKPDNIEEKFQKTFVLPSDYDITKIDRKFHSDGVLVISVPRVEGKPVDDFKTFFPENEVCDMQIKDDYVEIKLNIEGYCPEEIMIKVTGKHTVTIEGKQINGRSKINKSFMKSYILPSECDTQRIKKHITSCGILIVRVPRSRRTSSLENLSELGDQKIFSNGTKNGSVDNLSEPDDQAMVDSAELDQEKFEMKFNVFDFQTEDIYVKINKRIVTIECKHPNPGRSILKSYLVPKAFDLTALQTYITHDDILIVTIPKLKSHRYEPLLEKMNDELGYASNNSVEKYNREKYGDNYVIRVDIRGYNNNDISVDIKGQNVIVQGGHLGNRTISRSFNKNFNVPSSFDVEKMTYYISAGGFLIIEIPPKLKMNENGLSPKLYTFPQEPKENFKDYQNGYNSKSPESYRRSKDQEKAIRYEEYKGKSNKAENNLNSPRLDKRNDRSFPDSVKKGKNNFNKGTILLDDDNNEVFQIMVDVHDWKQKDINVRIRGQNLRVEGQKEIFSENRDSQEGLARNFSIPDTFDMKGIKTRLENGILFISIPKMRIEDDTKKLNDTDILSNVKINRENIVVEMDANGLRIEDFEISTYKNILTIEVTKGGVKKFKTKVDLPEDSIIDDISKTITPEGQLKVTVPRKIQVFPENKVSNGNSSLDENSKFIAAEKRRSCLVLSKPHMGEKSKSVKFLVDGFEDETTDCTKFATLPRSARSKSYNCLYLEDTPLHKTPTALDGNFELKIFVPHHEPDEVVVKLRGSTITIEGRKKNDKRNTYFSKNFFKTYIVPKNIDATQLKTTFLDSYLIITAPKKSQSVDISN